MTYKDKIIEYLGTVKEANIYEIQANINFFEHNMINKLKSMLKQLIEDDKIRYVNSKYRIVKQQQTNNQINLF